MNRRWTPPQRRFFFLLLFVFLLLAGGIAALGYGNYRSAQDRLRAQTKDQLAAIAALKAGELEKWKNERLADAAFFYQNREFSRRVENYLKTPAEENTESLLAWLEKTAYSSEYRRAALLDAQGRERLSVPSSSESLSPEMTLQVSKILEAGNLTFLDFHTHSDSTEIYLSVAIPLFSAEKQPLGVLLLQIDPNQYIYPYLQRWPLPSESGETLLVRREGNEVVFLNQLRFKKDAALNLRIPLQREQVVAVKAALGTEGFTEGVDYRGTPVLAEIRAIPNSPWLLIAKMDKSEVYAPLRGRLRQDVVFSALLTLTSAAALALIWRKQEADRYRAQIETLHALRASEKKFRVAFDTNPDAVSISRLRDGVFVSVNKGFEKISGYAREEILGKTAVELNLWKDPQERNKFIEQLLAKGRVQNYEADFCARSGEIQGLVSAALMELDGEPHLLNIVHDISNRKRAEETLRQAEEKYPSIFENAVEGIFQSLPDGRFINVNPAFARMLGYESPAELLENITDIAAQTYVDKERRVELMRLIEEQGVVAGFEFRMKRRDGSEIWVRENARAVCDAAGNLLYYEGFAEDITERKKAEQA
ncbi:MAG: PAS domain S-box protein, partial [Chloroflexi bacterium]|nr:PAS domain S-box protein [Chloroflexota bacterium]